MTKLAWLKAAMTALILVLSPLALAADSVPNVTQQLTQLDINSANAVAIAEALDGVGIVKAEEIVAYRELFGKFRSVDELAEVQGIGVATVEKNRERIVITSN